MLKAFYVDDYPCIYAAESLEQCVYLLQQDNSDDPVNPDSITELTDAQLDEVIPEYDDNEQPTGHTTCIRAWLADAQPGFLAAPVGM